MTIWLDADSCPKAVREIVSKRCLKERILLVLVANRPIPLEVPNNPMVQQVIVQNQEGAADHYIFEKAQKGSLVITRDIPFAASLINKGVSVINDRGQHYDKENVRERLSLRNWMEKYRLCGGKERHSHFGEKELKAFANAFDKTLAGLLKNNVRRQGD